MKSFIWNGVKKGLEYTIAGLTCWGVIIAISGALFVLYKAIAGLFGLFSRGAEKAAQEAIDALDEETLGPIPVPVANETVNA